MSGNPWRMRQRLHDLMNDIKPGDLNADELSAMVALIEGVAARIESEKVPLLRLV